MESKKGQAMFEKAGTNARASFSIVLVLSLALTAGCATKLRNQELEAVAKDWSMVIRASQVIPVYPLTEDLQPGDVFLVQVPIDRQQVLYRQRGFLPLDNLVRRVNPGGYLPFYLRSFAVGDDKTPLPKTWLKPGEDDAWRFAPKATFPSYSFSVRSGGGFNVALPVQGVPVGLSLLGGEAAAGTISIADARTYGVDTVSLHDDVVRWARENRSFLQNFASAGDRRNYLRVVSRVYLAKTLNVSLQSTRNRGLTASGGAPKPVPLDNVVPTPGPDVSAVTLESYKKNVTTLNEMIEAALKVVNNGAAGQVLPGGTVKIVSASAGSVSLQEAFARPLVIGYLGFDIPIVQGGMLGPPIPTHAILEGRVGGGASIVYEPGGQLRSGSLLTAIYQVLDERRDGDLDAKMLVVHLDALAKRLPERYPCTMYEMPEPRSLRARSGAAAGDTLPRDNFRSLVKYRGGLAISLNHIRTALADPQIAVTGREPRTAETDRFLRDELARTEAALKQIDEVLAEQTPLIRQAADHAAAIQE
jgi:hypothetical protein